MQQKAWMIIVIFFIYSLISAAVWTSYWKHNRVLGAQTDLTEAQVIALTNVMRQQDNMPPLKPNLSLARAALAKAEHMVKHQYWDHFNQEVTPWQFLDDENYVYSFAGENLAKGFSSSVTLVSAWMQSPGHRANIMSSNYQEIGVAILPQVELLGEETSLIVQILAKPAASKAGSGRGEWSSPPPLSSWGAAKEILSVKPLIYIFGSAGLATFLTTVVFTLLWDRRRSVFHPAKRLWRS